MKLPSLLTLLNSLGFSRDFFSLIIEIKEEHSISNKRFTEEFKLEAVKLIKRRKSHAKYK